MNYDELTYCETVEKYSTNMFFKACNKGKKKVPANAGTLEILFSESLIQLPLQIQPLFQYRYQSRSWPCMFPAPSHHPRW